MMRSFATVLKFCAVLCLLLLHLSAADSPCTQVNSCKCTSSAGDIDLSALDNPAQPLQITDGQWIYKYNPCTGFTCGSNPNVAVCLSYQSVSFEEDVGDQKTATFGFDNTQNMNYIKYTGTGSSDSQVFLKCDATEAGKITSATGTLGETIQLTLASKSCCPASGSSGSSGGGLSVGSVLLIVFFSLVFAYFVGGMLFMHFVRHESGVNLIPNVTFWVSLPALVRDGCVFTYRAIATLIRGCRRDGYVSA